MATRASALIFTLPLLLGCSLTYAATVLFSESFDDITAGYDDINGQQFGVPLNDVGPGPDGVANTLDDGADNDWYAARFESDFGGNGPKADVGAEETGDDRTPDSPVGLVEDDAGLLVQIDTTGLENLTLSFDWRTGNTNDLNDKLTVGYFVGDLGATADADRQFDLIGQWTSWTQLMSEQSPGTGNPWSSENFSLAALADDSPSVWIAFWMDSGEGQLGKFDDVVVMGDQISSIPIPASVWLFGSGLLGLVGMARRKKAA